MQMPPLSDREREVVILVARGLTSPAIAAVLGISVHTVHHHIANARFKVHARSITHLVVRAMETGEVTLDDLEERA